MFSTSIFKSYSRKDSDHFSINGDDENLSSNQDKSTEMTSLVPKLLNRNNHKIIIHSKDALLDPLFHYLDYACMSKFAVLSKFWNMKVRNSNKMFITNNYEGTYSEICDENYLIRLRYELALESDYYTKKVENFNLGYGCHYNLRTHVCCTFSSLLYSVGGSIYYSKYSAALNGLTLVYGFFGIPGTIAASLCGVAAACQTGILLFKCANKNKLDKYFDQVEEEINNLENKYISSFEL